MSSKWQNGEDRGAEPQKKTRGIGKAIKAQRGTWLGGTFGTIATGIGTTVGVASGLAGSGALGMGASAVGTGILAVTATASGNILGRDRTAEAAAPTRTSDATSDGGGSGGGTANVKDVAAAVGAVVGNIRSDAVNSAIGIKTRIEVALGRILAAAPVSSSDAPEKIERALQGAMREADQVQRSCVSAIDKAEDWAKGL